MALRSAIAVESRVRSWKPSAPASRQVSKSRIVSQDESAILTSCGRGESSHLSIEPTRCSTANAIDHDARGGLVADEIDHRSGDLAGGRATTRAHVRRPRLTGSPAPRAGGSSPLPQDALRSWSRGCLRDPLAVEADGIPAASSSPPCEKRPGISAHLPAHVSHFDHRWSRHENDREPTTGNYGYPPTSIARRRSPSASRSLRRHYPEQVPAASVPPNALSARCPSSRVCERTLSDLDASPI
jgi:hypothetical protein